jgi:hypothetical protein
MMMGPLSGSRWDLALAAGAASRRRRAGRDGSAQGRDVVALPKASRGLRSSAETTHERAAMNAPVAATEDLIYSVEDGIAG